MVLVLYECGLLRLGISSNKNFLALYVVVIPDLVFSVIIVNSVWRYLLCQYISRAFDHVATIEITFV